MPYVPPPDYTTIKRLARDEDFVDAVTEAIRLKRKIAELEEELKQLNDDVIEPTLASAKLTNTTIMFGKVPIALRDVSSGFVLDESKLVLKGVSKKLIEQCRVEKARRHYVEYGLTPRGGKAATATVGTAATGKAATGKASA